MVHIPYIQFELLLPAYGVTSVALSPSCYAGPDFVAACLLFAVEGKILDKKWPWTYQRHISLQYIYQLRKLINGCAAHKPADFCKTVSVRKQVPVSIPLVCHCLELYDLEYLSILARPWLKKEHTRSLVGEMEKEYEQDNKPPQKKKGCQRN